MNDPLLDLIDHPKAIAVDALPNVFICETGFDSLLEYSDMIATVGNDRERILTSNAFLFRHSVCNADGVLRYTDADLPKLRRLPRRAVNALTIAIAKLNGIESKAVEDESKNSSSGPSDTSQ